MELQVACGICSTTPFWKAGEPANNDVCERWVKWVQAVRKDCGSSVLISPRASLNGVKALRAGIPIPDVAEALVFKLVSNDTRDRMLNTNPLPRA